ncbi:hypothetical protein I9W82_005188 [Candida metapsilosis]|uniref:Uncharacterized protein n=1 Tax=Candida metapsilosis TaxID=273372 RepID=A0A8H7Z949_9ASCO|nr:hypothetical protein I9W82_005188 [Candida metapsilosis]
MLSSRVVTKQLAKAAVAKTPQFILPTYSTITKHFNASDQPFVSKCLIRGYATHVEDYEIDYISLKKKTKKKGEDSGEKLDLDTPLPNFTIERPENVGFPYHRIHKCNEELMQELLDCYYWDFKIVSEDGYPESVAYTKHYYDELKVFESFLQDTFNYRIKNFADLSGSEIVNTLYIFKDHYTRGQIPEVTTETKPKYDEMVKYFIEFVNHDAQFPQEIVKECLPVVKHAREISNFLDLGLYFYVPELKSLDREFNFKRIRSKNDLVSKIDKTVKEFDQFLKGHKNADESFFKVLIQVERYKALRDKLSESTTPLKVMKNLVEKHNFGMAMSEIMFEDLDWKFDREEYDERVAELGVLWSKLEFGNFIPATSKYEVLAPRLYDISVTPNHPFKDEANKLLDILTTDELRSGMLLSHLTDFNFHTSKYKFTGNLEEDWILNHLLKWGYELEEAAFGGDDWYDWSDFDHEDWYSSDVYYCMSKETIQRLARTPEILIKYLKLKGDDLSACLPKDLPLLRYKEELSVMKKALGVDFSFYADANHLINEIEQRLTLPGIPVADIVCAIEDSSKYIVNHLEVLDDLVKEKETERIVPTHANENYKQIPEWLHLEMHEPEIRFLESIVDFSDKAEVMSALENVTNSILEDGNLYPQLNHGSLLTLRAKLKEFSYNNTPDCLEVLYAVILNNDVFAQFEKRMTEKAVKEKTPYVQIPEELELPNFVEELAKLREALGGGPFKEHSSGEVLKALDYQIERFYDGDKDTLITSNSDSFNYIKLKRRLGRLFDLNGQNTEALDVLLNSQAVFDKFENEKLEKRNEEETTEYRQMPNDFFLEEYVLELKQLQNALNIEKFADVYADEILSKISEFSKASYSTIDKKSIWHKLYRNLALLFKHNHGSTFVLDNVLTSAAELDKLNKSILVKTNDPIEDQIELLKKEEYDVLGAFLTASRLLYKSDVTRVSKEEFDRLVDMYIATLDATSLGYLFKKDVLDSLKDYNGVIEHYPAFIVCLYGMSKNLAGETISKQRLQEFYSDLARSIAEETKATTKTRLDPLEATSSSNSGGYDISVNESTPEVEYEYDIRQYEPVKSESRTNKAAESSPERGKYHNSEQYFSDLDKQNEGMTKDGAFEDAVRAAFASALHEESQQVKATCDHWPRPHKRQVKVEEAIDQDPTTLDAAKLKEYLTKLNKEEISKQRQAEAYKWSKERYDQSVNTPSKTYLLLSLVGDEIPVSENLLRDELSHKMDIFDILNKFSDEELVLVNDRLQYLQDDNYKVVGYKVDGKRKYLILENEGRGKGFRGASGKSSWGKRATTGAVAAMLVYLTLSFVGDDPKGASEGASDGAVPPAVSKDDGEAKEELVKQPVEEAPITQVPDLSGQEERVDNSMGSILKGLFWSTK